jgi:hypothetical protein
MELRDIQLHKFTERSVAASKTVADRKKDPPGRSSPDLTLSYRNRLSSAGENFHSTLVQAATTLGRAFRAYQPS